MAETFVPYAKPDIGRGELVAVREALESGWITTGPRVAEFEGEFARFLDVPQGGVVALNSATAGLHLALEALGVGPGDEVLVPTWTFTASAEVVEYLGATPVFVDVLPSTLHIDYEAAEAKVSPRTRVVMPVHFAGRAVPNYETEAFASRHGLHVVEDAAHSFPSTHADGSWVGSGESAATVFSFYANKTITTGEGGMLVTRDVSVANRARVMRLHGIDRDVYDRFSSTKPSWQYDIAAPGYKYNMTDTAAAMGLVQLNRAKAMTERRRAIVQLYLDAFASLNSLILPPPDSHPSLHSWHIFMIQLGDGGLSQGNFIEKLAASGVGCSVHYRPLHLMTYWANRYNLCEKDFPIASHNAPRVVSLPAYSAMTDDEVIHVIDAVIKVAQC